MTARVTACASACVPACHRARVCEAAGAGGGGAGPCGDTRVFVSEPASVRAAVRAERCAGRRGGSSERARVRACPCPLAVSPPVLPDGLRALPGPSPEGTRGGARSVAECEKCSEGSHTFQKGKGKWGDCPDTNNLQDHLNGNNTGKAISPHFWSLFKHFVCFEQ